MKKLAILGCAREHCFTAKEVFGKDFEIWGMNDLLRIFPESWIEADRWFDIHHPDFIVECANRIPPVLSPDMYMKADFPIYMYAQIKEIPMSVRYPIEDICKYYGKPDNYFNSSASLMLALALAENRFEQINIYGIDMKTDSEYERHRPAMHYLVGRAECSGVQLVLPANCVLLSSKEKPYFGMNGVL